MKFLFYSFLILFCYSKAIGKSNANSLVPAKLHLDTVALPDSATIITDNFSCSIYHYPTIAFTNRSDIFDQSMMDSLQSIAASLKNDPHCRIRIIGYAAGTKKSNLNLAWRRMNTIIEFLTKKSEIDPARILFSSCFWANENTFDIEPANEDIPFPYSR